MIEEKTNKYKIKEIITVLLGLCIVIGRVLLPTEYGVNNTTVILELVIELVVLVGVILLNKKKVTKIIEDTKSERIATFLKKAFGIAILIIVSSMIAGVIITNIIGNPILSNIIDEFSQCLPIIGLISQIIVAPITEELVFRMTLHDLIPNKILFVIISSILFAFIHDWFYFSAGLLLYFVLGAVLSLLYLYKAKSVSHMIVGHSINNFITSIAKIVSKLNV